MKFFFQTVFGVKDVPFPPYQYPSLWGQESLLKKSVAAYMIKKNKEHNKKAAAEKRRQPRKNPGSRQPTKVSEIETVTIDDSEKVQDTMTVDDTQKNTSDESKKTDDPQKIESNATNPVDDSQEFNDTMKAEDTPKINNIEIVTIHD